jgi:DNA processing protein
MIQPAYDWICGELRLALEAVKPVVISGGARGVDQAAHQLAQQLNLPTIVVLPHGLDLVETNSLWHLPGVHFVSPFASGIRARPSAFELRNRVLVAMSELTLVVQAQRRSGSTMSGRLAAEMGKPLAAVPWGVQTPLGLGGLDLIQSGALLVRDRWDLIAAWNLCVSGPNAAN